MKNLKLFLLGFALIAGLFTSCSDDDSVTEDQNIQQTEAITTSLERLAGQFDEQGAVVSSANPAGNIVFDFGFDFVYPLNLSFNNGTTVAISSLDELIEILINSTDDLFIDGIQFPFDVEVYDEDSDSIIIITINNEDEFLDLLESLDWDDQDVCVCTEEYAPVCVEVTDPDGTSFVISYPNECYALCDGFTPNDFVDNCEDDYNNTGGFECFELNFPLSIITDDNETITVNSQEELDNALYNAYYFDFVYPFEVTNDEGEIEIINDVLDLIDLLEDCYDEYEESDCIECQNDEFDPVCVEVTLANGDTEILTFPNACYAECEGFNEVDFIDDCVDDQEPCDCSDDFDPVCVEAMVDGQIVIYTFPNACIAECEGFSADDFTDCEDNNQSDCTEENVASILVECQFWTVTISGQEYTYVFSNDGTVTVSLDSDTITSGTWNTESSPEGEVVANVNTTSGNFSSAWLFVECDNPNGPEVISTANWISEIESGCL